RSQLRRYHPRRESRRKRGDNYCPNSCTNRSACSAESERYDNPAVMSIRSAIPRSQMDGRYSRRQLLASLTCAAVCTGIGRSRLLLAQDVAPATTRRADFRYKISASDWMLLKRQKPGALQLAKDCGLDGIELDMGPLGKRPD